MMYNMDIMETVTILRFLIIKRENCLVAQCLEYDLATQARDLGDLYEEIERLLVAHAQICEAEGLRPFECLPPAPDKYWKKFTAAASKVSPVVERRVAPSKPAARPRPQVELRLSA